MSTPWVIAFLSLWAVVLLEGALVLGTFRRVSIALETAEGRLRELPAPGPGGLRVGATVPPFVASRADGQEFTEDDLRGGVSLVLFLASGCPPCRTLAADLNQNPDEVYPRLFVILSNESEFIELGLIEAVPVVYQRDGAVARAFQTAAAPHAFLVNRDCTVIASGTPNSIAGLRRLSQDGGKGGDHPRPVPTEVHVLTR
jgi:thiol-disulfide isomerase/thioredoxin